MSHVVICRICKARFDTDDGINEVDWIMPTRNMYYHKKCYDDWKTSKSHNDEDYVDLIYDLIARDIKGKYNWQMIEAQRKKFLKQEKTNKGIYYTLMWYFLINKKEWKPEFGIGIVPSIYQSATSYWVNRENNTRGICEQYRKLAEERMRSKPIKIAKAQKRKRTIKAPE